MSKILDVTFQMPTDIKPLLEDKGEQAFFDIPDPEHCSWDGHMFVNLRSHHEGASTDSPNSHPGFRSLLGKRVRISVEVVDE